MNNDFRWPSGSKKLSQEYKNYAKSTLKWVLHLELQANAQVR